jgi:histidine triad (HIT) family protein
MSLTGDYDPSNIFAKILRGEAPCVRIHEDAETLSFMDVFPQSRGHCLVVPKGVSARNLIELPPERIAGLFQRVQLLAGACVRALAPDGVIVTQFNGAPAGQTVFHLHVHVIPRYADAALAGHGHGKMADMAILKDQAEKIARALEG